MFVAYANRTAISPQLADELKATCLSLRELVATNDVVSLHCRHTADTRDG